MTHDSKVEADIFSRGMGNKNHYKSCDWDGTGKMSARVGGTGNSNNTIIPNFIHKYTFYINKL